ncbi:MAG: hypothetical protein DMD28_07690 [Gemmatimonadetes bacterium]|nr:MAG: hypothetical protein DMD28_07690 [Gemmatimonadota bacterium]
MPYTSEIEKLERRYAENPKGRNFAPLADAYRKAGQVDQAIELCKSGLERHPDYVSAHIVYGRCLIDQKNAVAADQVFRKVLELDPENVIAFKVLADLAERSGRFSDAVIWLTKLLAADPMNGDAAEALAVAKGKAAQSPPVAKPTAPAPAVPGLSEAATAAIPKPDFVVEHTSVQPVTPAAPAPAPAGDLETFDGTLDFNAVAHDAAKAEGLEVQEEVVLKPSDVVVEGLARTQYEGSGIFKLDPSASPGRAAPPPPRRPPRPEPEEDELPTVDLPLILPEDVAPRPAPARRPTPPPVPAPPPAPPRASTPVAAAVTLSDDDGAVDTAALSRAEPVLTETMAELYLKQGHQEEALRVYQALLARRPADARLRARVDALSGRGKREEGRGKGVAPTGPTVQAFLRAILAARPGGAAPTAGASPFDSAFGVPSAEAEPGGGQPTYAAADNISLDQVFGDDSGRSSSVPDAPAMSASLPPAPAPPSPAASVTQTGGFSFDEFFATGGGSGSGAEGATGAGAPPAASRSPSSVSASGRRPKLPVEEHGDLDQFQAWLKGLKG